MKNKQWITMYAIILFIAIGSIIMLVYKVDPFIHYHKPCDKLYYSLNNQRSQNNGICKHFDYDGIITGTSMTENFKASEAKEIFEGDFIKVPFSGGSYKEINDNLIVACNYNKNLKMVIRCLDEGRIFDDKDNMRTDLGKYPTYLYDDNIFNDVNYVFNKDIIFGRIYQMLSDYKSGGKNGMTSFDRYSYWMPSYTFGKNAVLGSREKFEKSKDENRITEEEIKRIKENTEQNIVSLARKNPDIEFNYFISPYSAAWWGSVNEDGNLKKKIYGEKVLIEEVLPVKNINLYSFNDMFNITTDLNNYKDSTHYGEWVNSSILKFIKNKEGLLTRDNYEEYLEKTYNFYRNFDYNILLDQKDEDDRICDLENEV